MGIQLANGSWEKAKAAVDYAFHFPNHIHYNEHGHGLIISELKATLECMKDEVNKKFVLRVAQYAFELGQKIAFKFEDEWDWVSALEELEEWIKKVNA